MTPNVRLCLKATGAVLAAALCASQIQAQPRGPTGAPARTAPAAKGDAAGGDADLRRRVEQLEGQLVDMQVVIGTLESLAKGATAPAGTARGSPGMGAALGGADAGRIDALETQIRALTAQIEQMAEQIRAAGGRSGSLAPSSSFAANAPVPRPDDGQPEPRSSRSGFGTVTVSPQPGDTGDINRLLRDAPPAGPSGAPGRPIAAMPPVPNPAEADDGSSKDLYETAYGYLLQRDYGAAETAFDDFLRRHPNDPLAGNAQYWLGESFFVRGQYRSAASAFLKGYQTYGKSQKAAESLWKLAMSLQRLGQKDAACSSYNELTSRFPSAPSHVKTSAQTERQRLGC
jgi:tol-pal system protein YbgF